MKPILGTIVVLLASVAASAQTSEPQQFVVPCVEPGSNIERGASVPVELVYKWDAKTHRLIITGVAGGDNGGATIKGVPAGCRFRLPRPLPKWPTLGEYCIDTAKLGAKEQAGLEYPSFLFISLLPGDARPTWTVKAGEADHIESLCFASYDLPYIALQNSWNWPQVLTFVIAGEVRE